MPTTIKLEGEYHRCKNPECKGHLLPYSKTGLIARLEKESVMMYRCTECNTMVRPEKLPMEIVLALPPRIPQQARQGLQTTLC